MIFSMQTFVVKLASGAAALVASLALSLCNISRDTESDVPVAGGNVVGLRMTMTLIPIVGLLVAVFYFHKKYLLSEQKVEEIAAQVRERRERQ